MLQKFIFDKKTLIIAFSLLFLAKCFYSIHTNFSGVTVEDWRIAENIVKSGTYAEFETIGSTAIKLPIYPLFIAFYMQLFADYAKEMVVLTQHLLLCLMPFLLFKIARLWEKEKVAYIASWLFLLSPAYFYYSNAIEATNLFIPIFALWIYWASYIYHKDNYYLLFALQTAILLLLQATAAISVVLVFALLIKRFNFQKIMWLSIFALTFYSPWIIRNYLEFDKFIPTKSPFFQNIYTGYLPENQYFSSLKKVDSISKMHIDSLLKTKNDISMEAEYKKVIDEIEAENSGIVYKKALANLFHLYFVPPRYMDNMSISILIFRKLYVVLLFVFTAYSIFYFWNRNRQLVYLFLFVFVGFTIPYMLTHSANIRFKLDFEWLILCFVAFFLSDKFLANGKNQTKYNN